MTHEEAWIDVDWDLDFASFEWMVHLAACFNRHLPPNGPWNTWPDWPTDMIGRVPEIHRPGWLSACHLVHRHPSIAVKGNTITVTDAHGTARVLEDVDVTCRWWHVDVTSDWNVPPRIIAALDARHGPSASHKFVPGQMEQICMGVEDDGSPTASGLPRCFRRCSTRWPCTAERPITTAQGAPPAMGQPTGKASGDRGWSTGRKWPTSAGHAARNRGATDPHRSTNSVSTASTINTSRSMPVTAWAVKWRRIFGPGSSTAVKGQSFSASSRPPRSPTKGRR